MMEHIVNQLTVPILFRNIKPIEVNFMHLIAVRSVHQYLISAMYQSYVS